MATRRGLQELGLMTPTLTWRRVGRSTTDKGETVYPFEDRQPMSGGEVPDLKYETIQKGVLVQTLVYLGLK